MDPQYFEGHTFNAANVSQSLLYNFEILKKYAPQLHKLHTVIVPISYLTLFSTLEDGNESWRVKNYKIYFNIDAGAKLSDNFEVTSAKLEDNIKRLKKILP